MTFRFEGHLDEIYATLVVRLHHTDAFKYTQLWLDAADFESLTGEKIGLKMTRHEGQGEITVFADGKVGGGLTADVREVRPRASEGQGPELRSHPPLRLRKVQTTVRRPGRD